MNEEDIVNEEFKSSETARLEGIIYGWDKKNWYCIGRLRKEDYVNYCIHAYHTSNEIPMEGCTQDCKFYKELHSKRFKKTLKENLNATSFIIKRNYWRLKHFYYGLKNYLKS